MLIPVGVRLHPIRMTNSPTTEKEHLWSESRRRLSLKAERYLKIQLKHVVRTNVLSSDCPPRPPPPSPVSITRRWSGDRTPRKFWASGVAETRGVLSLCYDFLSLNRLMRIFRGLPLVAAMLDATSSTEATAGTFFNTSTTFMDLRRKTRIKGASI